MGIGSAFHRAAIFILISIISINSVSASCPYNCTNNGACEDGTCICNSGWTGKYCQYGIYPLPMGSTVSVNATSNSTWAYFQTSFHGSYVSVLIVTVTVNSQLPDQAGIFAAYNYVPTYGQYDFRGQNEVSSLQLVVEIPRTGDWFFAVRGVNMTFNITANIQTLCPNNCSMHGLCQSNGQCNCIAGWSIYDDCSQESSTLQMGGSVSDQTVYHAFNYYQLAVNSDATLTIQLKTGNGKPEKRDGTASYSLFVAAGYTPTLNLYDYVSRSVGSDGHVIKIERPPHTTLMIGVWGHDIYNYTLTAYNNVTCPNNCNGNGVCLESGICKCNDYWSQEDCSLYRQAVTAGSAVHGSILSTKTKYYSIVVTDYPKTVEFDFSVNPDSVGLNPIVAIVYQYDQLPHLLRYAKRVLCNTNCSMVLENAPLGNHVFGVINQGSASAPLNYTLTASVNIDCPNNCSSNGQCLRSTCQCNKWYQMDDCSLYIEGLEPMSTSATNTISQGQWRFYEFNVTTSTFLVFYIQPSQRPAGNLTLPNYRLFAQFGRLPSVNNYIKSTAAALDYYQELLIEGSANIFPGTWYFGVYGLGPAISYTVSATFESYCPRNCSGHGVCGDNFQCVCDPPYFSDDCSSQDLPISTGVFTAGTISFDRWNYYHMSILGDDALEVTVAETREDHQLGLIWVFAKKNGRPTIDDNDYRNQSDTSLLTIWIPSTAARGNWTIGITGSPRNHGIYVERATYTLIALTGCETYTACSSCVADPNCGWCWNDLNDPNAGLCTAGDQHHSFTENCVVYQFDTCDVSVPQAAATFKGIILGIAVGLGGLLLLGGIALFIWRRHQLRLKQKMRPTQLLQAHRQYQQDGSLLIDPKDTDPFLSGGGQPTDNFNNAINAAYDNGSRKYKKKKVKKTTRIAKYGSMLDAEGYSSLSNTIGVDVHTDDEDEESSSDGESILSSTPKE